MALVTKIGPYEWTIELNEDLAREGLAGRTCCDERLIELNPYNDPKTMFDTFVHECWHAILHVFGFEAESGSLYEKHEHAQIYTTSTVLTQMIDEVGVIDFKAFDKKLRQLIKNGGRRRR